jgi:hypothetical protein
MKYKVHFFKISGENDVYELEQFLNNLYGEVISIIPKIKKLSLPQIMDYKQIRLSFNC